jgi:hypothetical protein
VLQLRKPNYVLEWLYNIVFFFFLKMGGNKQFDVDLQYFSSLLLSSNLNSAGVVRWKNMINFQFSQKFFLFWTCQPSLRFINSGNIYTSSRPLPYKVFVSMETSLKKIFIFVSCLKFLWPLLSTLCTYSEKRPQTWKAKWQFWIFFRTFFCHISKNCFQSLNWTWYTRRNLFQPYLHLTKILIIMLLQYYNLSLW